MFENSAAELRIGDGRTNTSYLPRHSSTEMDGMSNLRSCGAALSHAIKSRKELASSLASGPSLGYLVPL